VSDPDNQLFYLCYFRFTVAGRVTPL